MTPWYLFAALVGWPLVGFFVLFGDAAEGGAGDGFDLQDAGAGDGGGDGGAVSSFLATFFSLTGLAFFAAFFGLTGLVLGWIGTNPVMTAIWAVLLGLVAAWTHGALVSWLIRNSSDSSVGERHIVGRTGRVTVPLGADRKGRVAVDLDGQDISYVALPYRPDNAYFGVGDLVVVVEIDQSIALVTAMDDFE